MNKQTPCPWAAVIFRITLMKHIEFEILGFLVQQPVPLATAILSHISYMLPQPLKHLVQMLILKAGQVVANSGTDLHSKITRFTNSLYKNSSGDNGCFCGTLMRSISMPLVVSLMPVNSNSKLQHCILAFWHKHHSVSFGVSAGCYSKDFHSLVLKN